MTKCVFCNKDHEAGPSKANEGTAYKCTPASIYFMATTFDRRMLSLGIIFCMLVATVAYLVGVYVGVNAAVFNVEPFRSPRTQFGQLTIHPPEHEFWEYVTPTPDARTVFLMHGPASIKFQQLEFPPLNLMPVE